MSRKSSLSAEFVQGLKESPAVFFAPVVSIFRAIDRSIDRVALQAMRRSEAGGKEKGRSTPRPTC